MEILKFLNWQWNRWQTWQKVFIAAMILQLASLVVSGTAGMVIWAIGFSVTLGFLMKWFIWDLVSANYIKYKEERNKLFGVIKDSDN